ncbi:MAG: protein kinase [Deltaproteobacteria bacterium]|nr:protein kinase [Deltaproteobacteria bacterium]
MGEVWAAQHASLDIPCAVKFIHAESADKPEVRARFEREAKAAAQLRSGNVVQILDYGVYESTPYIAMEYLDGEPLNARLKRRGRLDAHETVRIIAGVGKALTKAHAAGIIHRDLKPENVFLVPDDDAEVAKVLDFGVAKSTTSLDSNTRTGALLGTPFYMSPEQAQGTKTIDHRADLWSLAVVAYRCLTGELPFQSEALGDLLIKIVTQPVPVPSQVVQGVPEGFDGWWNRASQRDPNYRYQTARELVDALKLALGVSMPSLLGSTPMPGGGALSPLHGAVPPHTAHTVVGNPATMPGDGLPFAQQGVAAVGAATSPGPHGSGMVPVPSLNDSGAAGSVAGIAAPPQPSSGAKVAVIGAMVAMAAAVAVGAVLLLRDGTPESSGETDESAEVATEPDEGVTASESAAADEPDEKSGAGGAAADEITEPVDSAAPDDSGDAPDAPPPTRSTGKVAATPRPTSTKTKSVPTSLDIPTKPKPANTYDPGF